MTLELDAYVTFAGFESGGAAFALGDGTVQFEGGARVQAHDGAILAAAVHPSGSGLVTGGDDGRLVWTRAEGATVLREAPGAWVDVVCASPESGLIAFASGRELQVIDAADPAFHNRFFHDRTVAAAAFDPKGRRVAAATYGGAALWFARIPGQKPLVLKWPGSHIALAFSPDGKFLVSSMQDNQLHGWRISDGKDMRMGGYPAKVKSLAFLAGGAAMATSGAGGAVVWPFGGANGPMGKQAAEVGFEDGAMVSLVAASEAGHIVAAGLDDGRVWIMDVRAGRREFIKRDKGEAVCALAVSKDSARLAYGCEDGAAGVAAIPALG